MKKKSKRGHHRCSSYKDQALTAAKDLLYSPKIIAQILSAETDDEIEHIMTNARKSY